MRRVCSIAPMTRQGVQPPQDSSDSRPPPRKPQGISHLVLASYYTIVVVFTHMSKSSKPIDELDEALTNLAKLYQFRSLEERGYARLTVSPSYSLRDLYFNGSRKMSELAALLCV